MLEWEIIAMALCNLFCILSLFLCQTTLVYITKSVLSGAKWYKSSIEFLLQERKNAINKWNGIQVRSSRRFSLIVSFVRAQLRWWWKAVRQMVNVHHSFTWPTERQRVLCKKVQHRWLAPVTFYFRAFSGAQFALRPDAALHSLNTFSLPSVNVWASVWFDVYFGRLSVNNPNNRPYMIMSGKEGTGEAPFKWLCSSSGNPCVHFCHTTTSTTSIVQPQTYFAAINYFGTLMEQWTHSRTLSSSLRFDAFYPLQLIYSLYLHRKLLF